MSDSKYAAAHNLAVEIVSHRGWNRSRKLIEAVVGRILGTSTGSVGKVTRADIDHALEDWSTDVARIQGMNDEPGSASVSVVSIGSSNIAINR